MGYQLITPPATEPISLTDAKLHLKVDVADDDALITALIVAVRQYAEQETRRSLITQVWKYTFDSFPGAQGGAAGVPWGVEHSHPSNALVLEKTPVVSVDTVSYLDMASSAQTLPSTDYVVDVTSPVARITPVFGKVWPIALPQIAACSVQFTAGYGAAGAVPQGLKQWMLLRLGALYENREAVVVGRGVQVSPLTFVDSLLDPYRVVLA